MSSDRFVTPQPVIQAQGQPALTRDPKYASLRWRLLLPAFGVLLVIVMIAIYLVTMTAARGGGEGDTAAMQAAWQGVQIAVDQVYADLVQAAKRIAMEPGVRAGLASGEASPLRRSLELEALASDLDLALVQGPNGAPLAGLYRENPQRRTIFTFSTGAEFAGRGDAAPALIQLLDQWALAVTVPVGEGEPPLGQIIVARRLPAVLDSLRSSGLGQVALFSPEGELLHTTFTRQDALPAIPTALTRPDAFSIHPAEVAGYPFQVAYRPFMLGQAELGMLAVYWPSGLPSAADLARQALSLVAATLAAGFVIAAYGVVSRLVGRVEQVTAVVQRLAADDPTARTRLRPADELGELGRAVDVYADRVQQRQEALRTLLRRQRRENARLAAVFESLPDGVVVQDLDGRVILMNEQARQLLGAQLAFEGDRLDALNAAVTDLLGPALAPGLYALGAPHRIPLQERMLSGQAAAILTMTGKRVGTVVALRDITADVQCEETRERLLTALAQDVQEPLATAMARHASLEADPALQRFATEVVRSSVRLQQMIGQLRDLTDLGPEQLELGLRPLALDELFEGLLDEWRVAAEASGLALVGRVMQHGLHVLGDERRLRWALGNLLDNAIKYSPAGGQITLLVRRTSDRAASIIIQDSGVGITPEEVPHLFTRFFRGTPRTSDGSLLRVPGMGQGLFIARRVIEAHGGALRLQSEPGRGTQLDCQLPLTSPVALNMDARRDGVAIPVKPPILAPRDE